MLFNLQNENEFYANLHFTRVNVKRDCGLICINASSDKDKITERTNCLFPAFESYLSGLARSRAARRCREFKCTFHLRFSKSCLINRVFLLFFWLHGALLN